jgi:hypothetical protein
MGAPFHPSQSELLIRERQREALAAAEQYRLRRSLHRRPGSRSDRIRTRDLLEAITQRIRRRLSRSFARIAVEPIGAAPTLEVSGYRSLRKLLSTLTE